jgi:drug/metabolite transporter (DMT)-like permease
MQAGYLGGVWSAVKAGIGAGTVALLVGLQPVLTALWVTATSARAGGSGHGVSGRQWLGLLLGLAGLALVVWPKMGTGEVTPANLTMAIVALLGITIGTLYQKRHVAPCDVRTASAIQMVAGLAISAPLALLEPQAMDWHRDPRPGDGLVGRRAHARRQLAPLPAHPARRSDRGDEPALPRAAVHRR